MLRVSKRQREVLEAVWRYARAHGRMPSVRELGVEVGLAVATVHQHLRTLGRKGLLTNDGSAHGLRITEEGETGLQPRRARLSGGSLGDEKRSQDSGSREWRSRERNESLVPVSSVSSVLVPVIGTIAAGAPIEAFEVRDDEVTLSPELAPKGAFALRVRGSSMIEDHIMDGDLVIVRPGSVAENGQIAVALLEDGTATLKRVYRAGKRFRLQPANTEMEPIYVYVDKLQIQGVVTGVVRRMR